MCDDSAPMLPTERSQQQQHHRVSHFATGVRTVLFPISRSQFPTALHTLIFIIAKILALLYFTLSLTLNPQFHSDSAAVESYLTHSVLLTADLFRLSVFH